MTTTNTVIPQRIKSKSRIELERRILVLEEANAKCSEAIAAAVAAERERCIEIAITGFFDLTGTYEMTPPNIIIHTRRGIAAAIRARGEVTK